MEKIINVKEQYDTKKISEKIFELLVSTDNFYQVYKDLHWNIVGRNFYSLHLLFDKHADEIHGTYDEIAERIRQMDEKVGQVVKSAEKSVIKYYEGDFSNHGAMLDHLISQHNAYMKLMEDIIKLAQDEEDAATADLVTKWLEIQQQQRWFIAGERAGVKGCGCKECDCE